MFYGESELALDDKGRISIPTRYRESLVAGCQGRMTLARYPDGCLLLMPQGVWEANRKNIAAWPQELHALRRLILGSATDVEMDGSGRILVSPELRRAANLSKTVALVGVGSYFEVWDLQTKAAKEAEQLREALASPVWRNYTFEPNEN